MKRALSLVLPILILAAAARPTRTQAGPEPTVVPGENLVVEGVPPIPLSFAEETLRYTEFRTAAFRGWHPTRRELLITTRFGDTDQLHLLKKPEGARRQLTFFPDRVLGGSFQPKGGESIVFTKDVGGGEWYQIYRYDVADGSVTRLTDGGRSRNVNPVWSTRGDRLAYASNRRSGASMDVYVVDPRDPKTDRLVLQLEGNGWQPTGWSPDDSKLVVLEYVSANESYLWLADLATGQKTRLTPRKEGEKVSYTGARFSADGKRVWTTTDRGSEFKQLAFIEVPSATETILPLGLRWDVDDFALSEDGKALAFVTNENGISALHRLDTTTLKERVVPGLPIGVIGNPEFHKNGREIAFTFSSVRSPSDVYSLDLTTDQLERWTVSETGGLNLNALADPQLVTWKSFDGKPITGFYYRPPAKFAGKRPVVVNIHGGPEGQARPRFLERGNYLLNEMGVAMIFPNIRGSSGFGKTFLMADNGLKREDSYKDIDALLDWIRQQPDLDGERILVSGASYGGHMTLAVAANYNDKIRAAVAAVPPSNLVSFLESTESYRRDLRRAEYGDERDPAMREFLTRTAPLTKAGNMKRPLFIVQGGNDPRVPKRESEQIVAAVRGNGVPVWYLMAKDEGHGFHKKNNEDFQFYASVQFIREFLLK